MDFKDFIAGPQDEGRRLDKVLRSFLSQIALAGIYKSLRKGLIKVNDKKQDVAYKVVNGDKISVAVFLLEKSSDNSKDMLQKQDNAVIDNESFIKMIVFENEHILIVNKPSDLNVQKAQKNETCLADMVKNYIQNTTDKDSLSFKPGPLHRIDKMTCGLVCFSKSVKGASWFTQMMKDHQIKKEYMALVQGTLEQKQNWEDYIVSDDENDEQNTGNQTFHTVKVLDKSQALQNTSAKKCITTAIPVQSDIQNKTELTLVRFEIETGRKHQIRSQSSYHGYPLWGDTAYGGKKSTLRNKSFFLCSSKMEFPSNDLDIPPVVQIEIEPSIKKLLEKLVD